MLKLKALIYQYTGIYLAHKEEQEYAQSPLFWQKFVKMQKKNKMSPKENYLLLIGIWQAKNGFTRKS